MSHRVCLLESELSAVSPDSNNDPTTTTAATTTTTSTATSTTMKTTTVILLLCVVAAITAFPDPQSTAVDQKSKGRLFFPPVIVPIIAPTLTTTTAATTAATTTSWCIGTFCIPNIFPTVTITGKR
ncbi:hypothetical protein OTU49_011023 [Cherax quadricarinatus]|uniref:Uncharacterized protein n=1 Tax=Cherax quadricarinatus TaxID=27406 RepID=A0AAW0WDC9_CHEQU